MNQRAELQILERRGARPAEVVDSIAVPTAYLYMAREQDLSEAPEPPNAPRAEPLSRQDLELARALYCTIGDEWEWNSRRWWSAAEWREGLLVPGLETWLFVQGSVCVGFAELVRDIGRGEVEINYFGILPAYRGRGLGGHALTLLTRLAWCASERGRQAVPVRRVHLSTSSLDAPSALPNYLRRGYKIERVATVPRTVRPRAMWGPRVMLPRHAEEAGSVRLGAGVRIAGAGDCGRADEFIDAVRVAMG